MALYGRILIAVDGSEPSLNALRQGCRLGRGERARLMAVTVAPSYEGDLSLVGVHNLDGIMNEPCATAFRASKAIAQEEGVVLEHISTTGEIAVRIAEVANDQRADLIVLGYGRRRILERLLLGSAIPAVIAAGPCDVLVIPHDSQFAWQKLLVAVNEPRTAASSARRALDFARSYGAQLLIASSPAVTASKPKGQAFSPIEDLTEWEQTRFFQELEQRAEAVNLRTQFAAVPGRLLSTVISLVRREAVSLTMLPRDLLMSHWGIWRERGASLVLQRFPNPVLVVSG
jgi:nucleotide-binding universal stress UspA family protein